MKICTMCAKEQEEISAVQVVPATWNGFNNFATVCAPCQETRRFKTWAKTVTAKARASASAAERAATITPSTEPQRPAEVQIAHRQTGALLHTVASHTLAGADLCGAALSSANLQHAGLRGTDLHRADLHLADLAGADLRGADLRAVNFRGADLRGADLREARLNRADLNHSLYDARTQWPSGFDPHACGALRETRRG
jgi:hypothetical protein